MTILNFLIDFFSFSFFLSFFFFFFFSFFLFFFFIFIFIFFLAKCIHTVSGHGFHGQGVSSLAFHPNNNLALTGSTGIYFLGFFDFSSFLLLFFSSFLLSLLFPTTKRWNCCCHKSSNWKGCFCSCRASTGPFFFALLSLSPLIPLLFSISHLTFFQAVEGAAFFQGPNAWGATGSLDGTVKIWDIHHFQVFPSPFFLSLFPFSSFFRNEKQKTKQNKTIIK